MTVTTDAPCDRPAQTEGYTVTTVLLLVAGGFVLPIVGWFAGVVMLWAGPRWSAAEKWLGTVVWPAVVVAPLVCGLVAAGLVGPDARSAAGFLVGAIGAVLTVLVGLPWTFVHLLRAARR